MRTIAVANQKGGVGKTTVSINLASALARMGHRVLLVDLDPQGHCAVGLAVPDEQIENGIGECLRSRNEPEPIDFSAITWQIAPNLDLAPSRPTLADFERKLGNDEKAFGNLREALQGVSHRYDFVLIDCPPYLGALMHMALHAAAEIIIPVETGYFSLHGLTKQLATLDTYATHHEKVFQTYVLANQYDVRTKLAREILAELRRKFKSVVLDSVINFNTKLKEGASLGQPIAEFAPGSMGARDFQSLAGELLARALPAMVRPQMATYADRLAVDSDGLLATSKPLIGREYAPAAAAVAAPSLPPADAPSLAPPARAVPLTTAAANERVDEKLEAVYGIRQSPEGIVFRSQWPGARQVQLAGDFNEWMPHTTPLTRLDDAGLFETVLKLSPGRYRYRLVVDGRWAYDRENPNTETNEYGEINSVVEVE